MVCVNISLLAVAEPLSCIVSLLYFLVLIWQYSRKKKMYLVSRVCTSTEHHSMAMEAIWLYRGKEAKDIRQVTFHFAEAQGACSGTKSL